MPHRAYSLSIWILCYGAVGCASANLGEPAPERRPATRDAAAEVVRDASVDEAEPDADRPLDGGVARPPEPARESVCNDGLDEDADGRVDEGCACEVGTEQPCYPDRREPVGACTMGLQRCEGIEFGEWGACEGAVLPEDEICGDGVDQDCDGRDLDCPRPSDRCDTAEHTQMTVSLSFPNPGGCPWGEGDNGTGHNGFFDARVEQIESLGLPEGAVVCGMDISVPESSMYFDDHVLLTFNDILLTTDRGRAELPGVLDATDDGMLIYDWSSLFNVRFFPDRRRYCLGTDSECQLPRTERNGSIALHPDEPTIRALSDRAADEGRYDFGVITVGDDNYGTDCRHTAFTMNVALDYVLP